jgi:hypothetical protein
MHPVARRLYTQFYCTGFVSLLWTPDCENEGADQDVEGELADFLVLLRLQMTSISNRIQKCQDFFG